MALERDEYGRPYCQVLATDPASDSLVRLQLTGSAYARLLHIRGREAAVGALPTQDYALLAHMKAARTLSFCVCDGVGSSYFGGFAALHVARHVVPWLARRDPVTAPLAQHAADLARALDAWASDAHRELPVLPATIEGGAIVREVLEELRDDYGSETMFLSGRIDLGERANASVPARILLFWMGNVTARLHTACGSHSEVIGGGDNVSRWSTRRHVRGNLGAAQYTLGSYNRLVVYTDGAESVGPFVPALDDDALRQRAAALRTASASDDVTILDMVWDTA